MGADGCNGMTGGDGGVIACFEEELGRPVQWAICLLHFSELGFKVTFNHCNDGKNTGPSSWTGKIGEAIMDEAIHHRGISAFKAMGTVPDLSEEVLSKISRQHQQLYRLAIAVSTGNLEENLALQQIGKATTVRWTTCQSRVLRLYMSVGEDFVRYAELCQLVKYIMTVYIPLTSAIRREPSISFGAKHFLLALRLTNDTFSGKLLKDLQVSLQRNAFYAHPEAINLTLIASKDLGERLTGWENLNQIRHLPEEFGVRTYWVPTLNWNAQRVQDLTTMKRSGRGYHFKPKFHKALDVTEPPLIMYNYPGEEGLEKLKVDLTQDRLVYPEFPCHTQSVERSVKLNTESGKKIAGRDRQMGNALNVETSRVVVRGKVTHARSNFLRFNPYFNAKLRIKKDA